MRANREYTLAPQTNSKIERWRQTQRIGFHGMKRFLLTVFLAALAASPAEPATVVAKPSPPVVLPNGREVIEYKDCRRIEKGDQCELVFAQKDADTRQVRLVFEARFDWSGLGGVCAGPAPLHQRPTVGWGEVAEQTAQVQDAERRGQPVGSARWRILFCHVLRGFL